MYNLAARGDCVVDDILANAVVVILPIQNPDGREEQTRRNLNGFDMNRDWFARTQPETDGKLEVLRKYPPMLYVDAHEFGLSDYFFPPNADPEYHEIPDQAHDWINNLYSTAISAEFNREGIKFFHGAPYDFFAIVFGDTVPATGFHAAGMTFEKEDSDPIATREHEHFTSMWASLAAGAAARSQVLSGWHDSWVQAYQEGVAGTLEPNAVFEPHHKLLQPVPNVTVRGYFFPNDPDRQFELAMLVRRLQRMDVEVRQLNRVGDTGRLPPVRRPGPRRHLPRRDVLRADGPGPEALGPGDAPRGGLDPVRRDVRRHGLEQPAADEPQRRLERRRRAAVGLGRRRRGRHADVGAALRASRRSGSSRSRTAPAASNRPARRATSSTTSGTCRRTT